MWFYCTLTGPIGGLKCVISYSYTGKLHTESPQHPLYIRIGTPYTVHTFYNMVHIQAHFLLQFAKRRLRICISTLQTIGTLHTKHCIVYAAANFRPLYAHTGTAYTELWTATAIHRGTLHSEFVQQPPYIHTYIRMYRHTSWNVSLQSTYVHTRPITNHSTQQPPSYVHMYGGCCTKL